MKGMMNELMSMVKGQQLQQKLDPNGIGVGNSTLHQFMAEVAIAKREGVTDLEAAEGIILHFNRQGLGEAPYFMYDGIRVWQAGKRQAYEKKSRLSTDAQNHPEDRKVDVRHLDQALSSSAASVNHMNGIRDQMKADGLIWWIPNYLWLLPSSFIF